MATKSSSKRAASLTKTAFVDLIAQEFDLTKAKSSEVLEFMVNTMKQSLASGNDLTLIGFGSFKVARRAARSGKNPRTGEAIKIAASKTVRFRPAPAFKDTL